jgi:hypothetical protein
MMLALLAGVLWAARTQTLASLSSPQAAADWQDWERIKRERQAAQAAANPAIQRRERKPSDEPPHLVILRDYFPGVLVSLAIVMTAFYVFLWNVVVGVLTSQPQIDLLPPEGPADGKR